MSDVMISARRIFRFATDGGMSPEDTEVFLNTKCYSLHMQNIPAHVIEILVEEKAFEGCLLIGVSQGVAEASVSLEVWISASRQEQVMSGIREAHRLIGVDNPYELLDFEKMDTAMTGSGYIRAMLTGAAEAGQDIS